MKQVTITYEDTNDSPVPSYLKVEAPMPIDKEQGSWLLESAARLNVSVPEFCWRLIMDQRPVGSNL
jgi:hypothetical protein